MNLIEQFIDYLRLELNYSQLTLKAYRTDLTGWADYATGGKPATLTPADMTTSDLRLWMGQLARSGCSPRSMRRKASALRSFFRFMMRYHGLKANPATGLTLPRVAHDLPVFIRPADTERILAEKPDGESENRDEDKFKNLRNRLIIDILYSTGIRCSELIGLLDVNVDTRKGELKVHGKRNKDRIIPFGPELGAALDSYRRLRDSSPRNGNLLLRPRVAASGARRRPTVVSQNGLQCGSSSARRRQCSRFASESACAAPLVCHRHAQRRSLSEQCAPAFRSRLARLDTGLHPCHLQ